MALKDWKAFADDYHKRAFISKVTGKIVSICKSPGNTWTVFTPYIIERFETLEEAKKRRLKYMMKNK